MDPSDSITARLQSLQARREQGVPTVAVLSGSIGLGGREWLRWNESMGRTVARTEDVRGTALVRPWVAEVIASADLPAAAIAWLASATGDAPRGAPELLGQMTLFDFERMWRDLPIDSSAPDAMAARAILTSRVEGRPLDADRLIGDISGRCADGDPRAATMVLSLCELIPYERWPALLVMNLGGSPGAAWLESAVGALEAVVATVPRLPVAVVVPADDYTAFVAGAGISRHRALAREGHVPIKGVSSTSLVKRLVDAGIAPPASETLRRLAADGVSEEAAAAFVETAKALNPNRANPDDSVARSAAERFLYEQLNAIPATAGLFRLNRSLDFLHGPRPAEADLIAERLKVVVELDGGYYHLTPEQYRRDRRKDWLYQTHGYLLLRFLAEDVVVDLDAIVAMVADAVALRRSALPPSEVAQ